MIVFLLFLIYLSFVSLGLPNSLLGSAWPTIYKSIGVPISYAGLISSIIALFTIAGIMLSARLLRRVRTGIIVPVAIVIIIFSLLFFSFSNSFVLLCLSAAPFGLGSGLLDYTVNRFVARYFKPKYMSWLHCFWGLGALISPNIMSLALSNGLGWQWGYRIVAIILFAAATVLLVFRKKWQSFEEKSEQDFESLEDGTIKQSTNALNINKNANSHKDLDNQTNNSTSKNEMDNQIPNNIASPKKSGVSISSALRIRGVKLALLGFYLHVALELTVALWVGSYLVVIRGINESSAAFFVSLYYIGMTLGRFASGLVLKYVGRRKMIRVGQCISLLGVVALILPISSNAFLYAALVIIGLGCAPVYPAAVHLTSKNFGASNAQTVISLQMASAQAGIATMPPIFGLVVEFLGIEILPISLLILVCSSAFVFELLNRTLKRQTQLEPRH